MKNKVAVIGLGMLGASLVKALKRSGKYELCVWARREETRNWAEKNQIADRVCSTLAEALSDADIAVLCVPVSSAVELLPGCSKYAGSSTVVTDIGSVKQKICQEAALYKDLCFVGSHPMAGTEKSGCDMAFAELYDNADVFVTPVADDERTCRAVKMISEMWKAAGCARVELASPAEHDELVADTSHVLHVLAPVITLGILDGENAHDQRQHFAGCATGFRDTTRIASGNPRMWREIVAGNTDAILASLERFEERYQEVKRCLVEGRFDDFERLFAHGKLLRSAWLGYKKPRPTRVVLCGIKHCGKSSVGKVLSELLPASFADSDDLIRQSYLETSGEALTVREIYRKLGEKEFRKLEGRCLETLSQTSGAMVTALGGGALSNEFVSDEILNKLGTVIWLDVPDQVAWERVKMGGIPPFLADKADPEAEFIRSNVERKKIFAAKSSLTITPRPDEGARNIALSILAQL